MLFGYSGQGIRLASIIDRSAAECLYWPAVTQRSGDFGIWLRAINSLTPELNPSAQRCLTRFLLGILLLEPCISLIYA
jgi:hypothetical protein